MRQKDEMIAQIRAFNRFYTVLQGFLDRDYLESGYSITEMRILFELKQHPRISASQLIEMLHLDKGYISRLIRGFEQKKFVQRQVSVKDGRSRLIQLTLEGQQEADRLIALTDQNISQLIAPLSAEECSNLCEAMKTIMKQFQKEER